MKLIAVTTDGMKITKQTEVKNISFCDEAKYDQPANEENINKVLNSCGRWSVYVYSGLTGHLSNHNMTPGYCDGELIVNKFILT